MRGFTIIGVITDFPSSRRKARGLVMPALNGSFQRPLKYTASVRTTRVSSLSPSTIDGILPRVFRLTQALISSVARYGSPMKSSLWTSAP